MDSVTNWRPRNVSTFDGLMDTSSTIIPPSIPASAPPAPSVTAAVSTHTDLAVSVDARSALSDITSAHVDPTSAPSVTSDPAPPLRAPSTVVIPAVPSNDLAVSVPPVPPLVSSPVLDIFLGAQQSPHPGLHSTPALMLVRNGVMLPSILNLRRLIYLMSLSSFHNH